MKMKQKMNIKVRLLHDKRSILPILAESDYRRAIRRPLRSLEAIALCAGFNLAMIMLTIFNLRTTALSNSLAEHTPSRSYALRTSSQIVLVSIIASLHDKQLAAMRR